MAAPGCIYIYIYIYIYMFRIHVFFNITYAFQQDLVAICSAHSCFAMFHGSHPPFAEPNDETFALSDSEYDSDISPETLPTIKPKKRRGPPISTCSTFSQPMQSIFPQCMYAHVLFCLLFCAHFSRIITVFVQTNVCSFEQQQRFDCLSPPFV